MAAGHVIFTETDRRQTGEGMLCQGIIADHTQAGRTLQVEKEVQCSEHWQHCQAEEVQ